MSDRLISMEAYELGIDVQINAALMWMHKYRELERESQLTLAAIVHSTGGELRLPRRSILLADGKLTRHEDVTNDDIVFKLGPEQPDDN